MILTATTGTLVINIMKITRNERFRNYQRINLIQRDTFQDMQPWSHRQTEAQF